MKVYRISKKEYIRDLSGIGAGLYGGRWNSKGINMLYTAGNISLAYVEFLVHNYHLLKTTHVCLACIQMNEPPAIENIDPAKLPQDWHNSIHFALKIQKIGDDFIKSGENYVLKVPSAVVPGEFNYLINPSHHHHDSTRIIDITEPLRYDERLLKGCE